MTYNPFDENSVLYESGHKPYQFNMVHHQPDEVVVNTNGGGSVVFGNRGAELSVGATDGDRAGIEALNPQRIRTAVLHRDFFHIWHNTDPDNYASGAEARVGIVGLDSGTGNPNGAYLDLVDQQFVVTNTDGTTVDTAPASNMPTGNYEHFTLVIDHRTGEGETEFILRANPGDSGSVVINRNYPTGPNFGKFARLQSDGAAYDGYAVVSHAKAYR